MTSLSIPLSLLIDEQPTLHVLNFFLESFELDQWQLIEVLAGFKGPEGSVDILLFQNNLNSNKVIRYEVIETASEHAADQAVRSINARSMTANQLVEVGLDDKTHPSDLVQGARLAFLDGSTQSFDSLNVTYANLAYRLESIGDEEASIEDLQGLKPNHFFRFALERDIETPIQVELTSSMNESNGSVNLHTQQLNHKDQPIWLMFLADTDQVYFSRQNETVQVSPKPGVLVEQAGIYVVWFDRAMQQGSFGPLPIRF